MYRLAFTIIITGLFTTLSCRSAPTLKGKTLGAYGDNTNGKPKGDTAYPLPTKEPEVSDVLKGRALAIHESIVKVLTEKFPKEKDKVWSESKMTVEDDFIVASPNNLWGLAADKLPPKVIDCKTENNPRCDADFKRMSCETQSDCELQGMTCEPLNSTVFTLNKAPKKLCITAADHLLDRFYNVMVSAEKELDITSLTMPDGRFAIMMNNALSVLSQKANPPTVRLLFSGKSVLTINILNPIQKTTDELMGDVRKLSPMANNLKLNIAWLSKLTSWNHSKIVVADGDRALAGGHNLWDDDYLRSSPISDLTLEYKGEAAEKARDYINELWKAVGDSYGSSTKSSEAITHSAKAFTPATAKVITAGRLANQGSQANPADNAIDALIDAATTTLKIDQQDYFNVAPDKNLAMSAFDHIIKAALRGVKVTLIQSNKYPLGNYGMVDPKLAFKVFHEELVERLKKEKKISEAEAKKIACESLVYMPFRMNSNFDKWPNGGGVYGSHTKLVMADDAAIYVGSQNLYKADLQEFGNIVTDAGITSKLKELYWDKLFKESSPAQLPCPK